MHKIKYGTYQDLGEGFFERLEGATRSGTSAENVATALNRPRFHVYGHFSVYKSPSTNGLLSKVEQNTYKYSQPVPMSVETKHFGYNRGHNLHHFVMMYGYDTSGSQKYVFIADSYSVQYSHGFMYSDSNGNRYDPYGKHKELAGNAYAAVTDPSRPFHRMIV